MRIFHAMMLAAALAAGGASADEACDSQKALAALDRQIRDAGANDARFLGRIDFYVPYFRMKDVAISFLSVSTKGSVRTGTECEAKTKMMPPPDLVDAEGVIVTFNYIVQTKPDGSVGIDLY